MFILKRLKVKGFRGYKDEKEFVFDNPFVLLFGENGQCKSSTLNAIEWCLFGNESIGTKSGIRERIDWEIPNRHLGANPDVSIEVELVDENNQSYKILRRWISKSKDVLKIILPDGQSLEGQNAKEKIAQLLKLSFRDFLTTVYQHQEAIRAVLTQEPKERNDAIDRLLGLSDFRNILRGIEAANLSSRLKKMGEDFDNFTREIDIALRTRENDLKEKREKAIEKGVKENQFSGEAALRVAAEVKNQLLKFSSEVGLSIADLQIPEQWKQLPTFQEVTNREIKKFRSEMPDVKKQQELYEKQSELTKLKTEFEVCKNEMDSNNLALVNFINKNGDIQSITERKRDIEKQIEEKKKELSETNAKAATIRNAIDCLKLEEINKNICPVCNRETPNLLEHLEKEWEEKFKKQVGEIQKQIEESQTHLKDLEELHKKYTELNNNFENAKQRVREINRKIGEALDKEIASIDDSYTILNKKLEEIKKDLEKLGQIVKSKQEILDKIVSFLEQMQLIVEILNLEEKKRIVEQIQQSSEYRHMEEIKDKIASILNDINYIKNIISKTSNEEAQQKLSVAGNIIDKYFRKITNNSSVNKIELSVSVDTRTGFNAYEFKDQNGRELTPILNQGDLNALALSIFLGMAYLMETNQSLKFIMLDDPSQSLGSNYKDKLVEILDEVAETRMIILSSMDKELQGLVLSKTTKLKTNYTFTDWSPQSGPIVRKD